MIWKQIKIYTCDDEQLVKISPDANETGICFESVEVYDKSRSFITYMSYEEAETIGKELIKYAEEMRKEGEK